MTTSRASGSHLAVQPGAIACALKAVGDASNVTASAGELTTDSKLDAYQVAVCLRAPPCCAAAPPAGARPVSCTASSCRTSSHPAGRSKACSAAAPGASSTGWSVRPSRRKSATTRARRGGRRRDPCNSRYPSPRARTCPASPASSTATHSQRAVCSAQARARAPPRSRGPWRGG
eukprot:4376170-Prymnesium_polylepis.1